MIKKVYCQNTHDFVSLGSIKSFYAAVLFTTNAKTVFTRQIDKQLRNTYIDFKVVTLI